VKRFRLSTLMLLVVIATLCVALAVVQDRASRREAELQARLNLQTPGVFTSKAAGRPVLNIPTLK